MTQEENNGFSQLMGDAPIEDVVINAENSNANTVNNAENNLQEPASEDGSGNLESTDIGFEELIGGKKPIEKPVEEDTNDVKSLLKQFGDDYTVTKLKERYEQLTSLEKRYEEEKVSWTEKERQFQKSVEEEREKQKLFITDEKLAKLNILKNKGVEDYDVYAKIAISGKEAISPLEILTMDMHKKYPELSSEKIKSVLEKQYGLNAPKPEYEDDIEEWETNMFIAKANMKQQAESILNKYEETLNSVEIPTTKSVEVDPTIEIMNKTKAKESWSPYMETFVDSLSTLKTTIDVDGEKIDIKYSIPKESRKKYEEAVAEFVYNNGISLSKENFTNVSEVAKTFILRDNIENIIKSAYNTASTIVNSAWEAKVGGDAITYKNKTQSASAGSEEDGFKKLMSQMY